MVLSAATSVFGRYEFLIRRLHSLTGLVPIGGYMFVHLATNDAIVDGAAAFQGRVDQIHSLGPTTLLLVEWMLHLPADPVPWAGGIGDRRFAASGTSSTTLRAETSAIRLQRLTGVIAFVFILWHVFQMHGWFRWEWWHDHVAQPLGGASSIRPRRAAATAAAVIQRSMVVGLLYVVGVAACVYHLANGLWTMGITWGVWTSPAPGAGPTTCASAWAWFWPSRPVGLYGAWSKWLPRRTRTYAAPAADAIARARRQPGTASPRDASGSAFRAAAGVETGAPHMARPRVMIIGGGLAGPGRGDETGGTGMSTWA